VTVILILVFIAGICIMAYPKVSDFINSYHQSQAIMTYMEEVSNMDAAEYDEWIESARQFNQKITENGPNWLPTEAEKEAYNAEMAYNRSGSMGYITIDKLGTNLSIYHGTSDEVLRTGIGHIEGSSLPVGSASWDPKEGKVTDPEEGVHIVLSGHRGLPSAKLFSDLDKLDEGDIFVLNILNETLTFQVDQIRVVEPTDLSNLRVIKGMDYCTLVTCTPYGINSHRLLVRGHRVENAPEARQIRVTGDAFLIDPLVVAPLAALPMLLGLLIALFVGSARRRARRKTLSRMEVRTDEKA
jgi:sortase A